jgi:hypothetical protein
LSGFSGLTHISVSLDVVMFGVVPVLAVVVPR